MLLREEVDTSGTGEREVERAAEERMTISADVCGNIPLTGHHSFRSLYTEYEQTQYFRCLSDLNFPSKITF